LCVHDKNVVISIIVKLNSSKLNLIAFSYNPYWSIVFANELTSNYCGT